MKEHTPTPSEIRAAREAAGLTQTEAARLLYKGLKTWQNWETEPGLPSHRAMDPVFWEYFLAKVELVKKPVSVKNDG